MIAGEVFEIGIQELVAGRDDERRSELERSSSGVVLGVACSAGSNSGSQLCGSQQRGQTERVGADDLGSAAVLVQQHLERNVLVLDEGFGVSLPAGADGDDVGTRRSDLFVAISDLTGPLTTSESTEVSQEQHDRASFGPSVSEAVLVPIGIDQDVIGESGYVEGHESAGMTSRANSSRPDVS